MRTDDTSATAPLRIAAGVLHYRHWPDVRATIDSLLAQTHRPEIILLYDHASQDGSADQLREAYPDLELIEVSENHGPAGGMSRMIDDLLARDADAIFPLPDDIQLAPDVLEVLAARLAEAPEVGAVAPLVAHQSEPELVFCAGGYLDTKNWDLDFRATPPRVSDWLDQPPQTADFLGTGGILMRAEPARRLAPIPAHFFHGFDDVDYTLRLAALGCKLECVPAAVVWQHLGDRDQDGLLPPANPYLLVRNHLALVSRNAPRRMLIRQILRTVKWLIHDAVRPRSGSRADLSLRLRGLIDFLRGRWGAPPARS